MSIRATRDDNEHIPCVLILNSSGGGVAGTIDSSYYKGQGLRQGIEREYIVIYEDNIVGQMESDVARGSNVDTSDIRRNRGR